MLKFVYTVQCQSLCILPNVKVCVYSPMLKFVCTVQCYNLCIQSTVKVCVYSPVLKFVLGKVTGWMGSQLAETNMTDYIDLHVHIDLHVVHIDQEACVTKPLAIKGPLSSYIMHDVSQKSQACPEAVQQTVMLTRTPGPVQRLFNRLSRSVVFRQHLGYPSCSSLRHCDVDTVAQSGDGDKVPWHSQRQQLSMGVLTP